MKILLFALMCLATASAQLLPHKLVPNWPQLPKGINFGECSGVDVDRNDNVWIFNRGAHPLIQLDKNGNLLQAFDEKALRIRSAHGVRVDREGNIWVIDVKGHVVLKLTPAGRVLMVLGRQGSPGNNDSKDGFHEPTGVAFLPN